MLIGGNLILKKSNKILLSKDKVHKHGKYHAIAQTICELFWLKYFLQELRFCERGPVKLYCDTQSFFKSNLS